MRRARVVLLACVVAVSGCAPISGIGTRFQAERSLWHLNREWQRLSIRPDLVTDSQRLAVARGYENLAARAGKVPAPTDTSRAGRTAAQTRAIAARAALTAGQIYEGMGRLTRADSLYREVEAQFTDLPRMAAEGAMDRGALAERLKRPAEAADHYQKVVDLLGPAPASGGSSVRVMDLPLRIARLRAAAAGDTAAAARAPFYARARAWYEAAAEHPPSPAVGLQARSRLVDLATDLHHWSEAAHQLRVLERQGKAMNPPLTDPGEIRFALAAVERKRGAPDSSAAVLRSLVRDAPRSRYAPQALLALASLAQAGNRSEEALADLDRVLSDYPGAEDEVAAALLAKAQILERTDRWSQALEILKALPVEHPLTEGALAAPALIVDHYGRVGDAQARGQALDRAEAAYRAFLERYPQNALSAIAQSRLADVLVEEKRYREAVDELTGMARDRRGTQAGMTALIRAAGLATTQLADTTRAIALLEQGGNWYRGTAFGRRIADVAAGLRGRRVP
jgi:TolA-binding protein